MDKALFQKIVDQVALLADEVVFHVLGEPLLHPDLEWFIDQAVAAGLQVMITTNGTLLTGDTATMLASKKIRQINISLHVKDQVSDKKKYYAHVLAFVRLAQQQHPGGYINLRFWNKSNYQKKRSRRLFGRVYLNRDIRFEWPKLTDPVLQTTGFCHGLGNHFSVLVDGTVAPCCLDGNGVIRLGTVREQPIADILKTDRAKKIAAGFAKNRVVEDLCQRCDYMRRF
jgi:radical SAM protein with 4Fe4S-binding SPASM domain